MNRFALVSARTVVEAAGAASALVAEAMTVAPALRGGFQPAIVKAGGIDLLDLMKEGLLAPAELVSLRGVPGLDGIDVDPDGGLRLGAMATLAALAAVDGPVARHQPALAQALRGSASPEIRNVSTLGGNLLQRPRCWYLRSADFHCLRKGGGHCFALTGESRHHAIFDNRTCAIVHPSTAATVLVALGAVIELVDAAEDTRRVPLEAFLVSPGRDLQRENDLRPQEILTAVVIPAPPAGSRCVHLRQGETDSFDWPIADVAVRLALAADGRCSDAAVVLGAAAPVPHRARAADAALIGRRVDEGVARDAAHAALDGATPFADNAYKLPLLETLTRRAIVIAARAG